MKHLSIFIALMLLTAFVRAEKNSSLQSDKIVSPLTIAKDLIVKNTINKVIERGLNKSPVDLEPNRFHILNNKEHDEKYRETATKVQYYPIGTPDGPTSALTPSNVRNLKRPALYHLDRKPYYGKYKHHRSIDPLEVDGQIKVPVVYMDLDDFKATEEQLAKLQERLENAKFFIPKPNGEFDGNDSKKLYNNDPKPYYDPMTLEKENGQEYLKQAINKVEMMLNKDERINPKNPPVFSRVPSKKISYQNRGNAEKEDSSNNLISNYYYPTTEEEVAKKKADEKKKQDDDVAKAKATDVKPDPADVPKDRKVENEKLKENKPEVNKATVEVKSKNEDLKKDLTENSSKVDLKVNIKGNAINENKDALKSQAPISNDNKTLDSNLRKN